MRAGASDAAAAAAEGPPRRRWLHAAGSGRGLAVGATALLLVATFLTGVLVHASLYADGAYYLLMDVHRGGLYVSWWDRIGANLITQAPLILGYHVGVHSMRTAVLLYSIGILGVPVLAYLLALLFSRGEWYLPFVAAAIVTVYPSTFFFSVSESVPAYAVYVLMAVILASPRPLTPARVAVLVACSLPLPFLYETSVLFGPVLSVWSVQRIIRDKDPVLARTALALPALTGAAAGAVSGWVIWHPLVASSEHSATNLHDLLVSQVFDWACVALVGAVALAVFRRWWALIPAGLVTAAGLVALVSAVQSTPPSTQWSIRLAPTLVLAPLMAAMWKPGGWRRLRVGSPGQARISYAVIALVAAAAVQNASLMAGWHDFFGSVQHQVTTAQGLLPYSHAKLALATEFGWLWAYPTLSRVVQQAPGQAVIENPDPSGWQPFEPAQGLPTAQHLYWSESTSAVAAP